MISQPLYFSPSQSQLQVQEIGDIMSEQSVRPFNDDTLLDEDLGDEEYDLGNDEEEALLADDYELERQNSYKGEEETDDVLDLGVTDALDDLDGEDDNIEFNRTNTDKHSDNSFYKDGEHLEAQSTYYEHEENAEYTKNQAYQSNKNSECNSVNVSSNIGKGDLREKLQKNIQKTYVGNGQGMEDDDCEEAKERRNRFQSERTMISTKMNNDIPDNLENVVTSETSRVFRGRGRGRGTRGNRGGRFNVQNIGHFNARFGAPRQTGFNNQLPSCRPPLIENRPPCLLALSSNIQNQQIMYQQANPQQPFQQFGPNNSMQGPAQFVENRPRFNPGQFQSPIGPRVIGPRLEYRPRGPVAGGPMQGPNYNCPPNQPGYHPIQPFQNPNIVMQENQIRPIQNSQNPILQGNLGCSLIGNPNVLLGGNSIPLLSGNLPLPMQGFPRQQAPPPSQGPLMQTIQNTQMPSQPTFDNKPFQEPQFESRNTYDTRPSFPDQISNSPFNNALTVSQQSASNIHSVSLPPGHKILINPHFRGAVQPANDTRLVWDSQQAQPLPQVSHSGQFSQSPPYQNQGPYHQSQQNPPQFQQNYQQNKSDDPYAYFSDVWQENRPQKHQVVNPNKQYTDNNYSRENDYDSRENDYDSNKYKSDNQWDQSISCQEDHRGSHQNYRERDLPIRIKNDHMQRSRTPPNTYRSEPYSDHNQKCSRTVSVTKRGINRLPQKRISENPERVPREVSPKRNKPPNNRNLQEIRRVETVDEKRIVVNKEEDNDPEMQEYRKKMEEQKRLREKLLREKENRRKMAAIEKQNEDVKNDSHIAVSENIEQETKITTPALIEAMKDNVIIKSRPAVGKGHAYPSTQNIELANRTSGVRIIRAIPAQSTDVSNTTNLKDNSGYVIKQANDIVQTRLIKQQSGTRRVVIQKPLFNSQKIATTIQKTVSNLQKNQGLQQKIPNPQVQMQKTIQNQSSIVEQKTVNTNQRMIQHKASSGLQKTIINVLDGTNVQAQKIACTQNPQRVVIQKSLAQPKKLPEIKTNTVKLENLAASTSEVQIKRMCQGIGTIESIHMGEGNATIVFKTQSAAMVFHKKYQRKMLDLSLITVRLMPHTASNKTITAVSKKS